MMKSWSACAMLLLALVCPAFAKTATNTRAPDFHLPTRSGFASLDSLRGRVVLVDFWASWCVPCRKSFPWLSALHARYGSRGLAIVAINLDKDRKAADAFLEEYPAPFVVAFDPGGETAEAFKVAAMPSSYIISPAGNILLAHAGFDSRKTAKIEAIIKEACTP